MSKRDETASVVALGNPELDDVDDTREGNAEQEHLASNNVLEMGRFMLKVWDGKGITQVVTDSIVRDLQTLVECSCESVEEQTKFI